MDWKNERRLLLRAQQGGEGFGELFDAYYGRIYAFAYRRVGSREVAEDIAACVFEDALRGVRRLSWQGKPLAAWLYRIANRRIADLRRHDRRHPSDELKEQRDPSDGPEIQAERSEEHHALYAALEKLRAADRELIFWAFLDELEPAEIAALCDCSLNSVYVRTHRALKRLRAVMEQEVEHGENENQALVGTGESPSGKSRGRGRDAQDD